MSDDEGGVCRPRTILLVMLSPIAFALVAVWGLFYVVSTVTPPFLLSALLWTTMFVIYVASTASPLVTLQSSQLDTWITFTASLVVLPAIRVGLSRYAGWRSCIGGLLGILVAAGFCAHVAWKLGVLATMEAQTFRAFLVAQAALVVLTSVAVPSPVYMHTKTSRICTDTSTHARTRPTHHTTHKRARTHTQALNVWLPVSRARLGFAQDRLLRHTNPDATWRARTVAGLGTLEMLSPDEESGGPGLESSDGRPVVVLVHGAYSGNAIWAETLSMLSSEYKVYAVEWLGNSPL